MSWKTLEENINQAVSDFSAIKESIINAGIVLPQGTPTSEYAAKIADLFEAGKKAEHDAFWDVYQANGSREDYDYGFAGKGWNAETFKPKYDIKPTDAAYMFHLFDRGRPYGEMVDLRELLNRQGVNIDFSQCTNFNYTFSQSFIRKLGVIDMSNAVLTASTFNNTQIEAIEKLIVPKAGGNFRGGDIFVWARNLRYVEVEGVIESNSNLVDLSYSPLSKLSIISFFNALSNDTINKTINFRLNAVNEEFETAKGLKDGSTSQEWLDLLASKPNWNVSLINRW